MLGYKTYGVLCMIIAFYYQAKTYFFIIIIIIEIESMVPVDNCVLYYQTKITINFWYRQE